MSTLPVTTRVRPVLRVIARTWNTTTQTWSPWTAQRMAQVINPKRWTNGFRLIPWTRKSLPGIGETRLIWYGGAINGRDEIDGPDLRGAEIRIQSAPGPEAGAEASWANPTAWEDVWWGVVQYTELNRRAGSKTYYAIDLLADFAQRTQITCHNVRNAPASAGHPGFNVPVVGAFSRTIGNRDASIALYNPFGDVIPADNANAYHTYPGTPGATAWTDKQTLGSLLQVNRRKGDPIFTVDDGPTVFQNTYLQHAWPVAPGTSLWSLLLQICDRRRARGVCMFDWDASTTGPLGDLRPVLRVFPQTKSNVYFGDFDGNDMGVSQGATENGTALALDYANDQRLCQGPVLAERSQYRYDYVETRGEPIQVLTTLAYADGSLAPRWTDADATLFNAVASSYHRSTTRWDPVYQRHGLPIAWDWMAGDGLGANKTLVNYRCADTGSALFTPPHDATTPGGSSLLTARILPDLCLYEGYDYSTGVLGGVRYDAATDTLSPPRLPPLILQKSGASSFLDLSRLGFSLQFDDQWGMTLRYGPDGADTQGTRYFGKTTAPATPGVAFAYTVILGTFTLELPHRVRAASGQAAGRRKLTIDVPGAHLWLAHPQAIWKLDRESTATAEAPALRGAGADPATGDLDAVRRLRDDRPWISIVHTLACEWYLKDHTPVTFSQRGPYWGTVKAADGTDIPQPRLCYFLTTLTTSTRTGTVVDQVNCPITSITYDPARDQTDVVADWADLDFMA
jgi:hypothetical protein